MMAPRGMMPRPGMGAGGRPFFQPQVILLKEGTDTSQGKGQVTSNINACEAIGDIVRSTLGPRGMDKLIIDQYGKSTISNDGATIMKLLDIVHPAAKVLLEISLAQDAEVGDGTTSVVLLACSMLNAAKPFVQDGMHPRNIIKTFRRACKIATERLQSIAVDISAETTRDLLMKCAGTALNSKLISKNQDFFAPMCVDAVMSLEEDRDLKMIGIKKIVGGSVTESFMVQGVAFQKTFSYAGFEQQPKSFTNPKILLLNLELELKAERDNAEVRIEDPAQYQSIVDAEWKIIYEKLELCVKSGASIILSKLPIGDLATQYFADRGLFCAGRVPQEDMLRVSKATGASVQTSIRDVRECDLGECGSFEERQIGGERYNLFTECPKSKSATIILRGGAEQFLEEAHRSLHDALMIVKRTYECNQVVAGGGACEVDLMMHLRELALKEVGKSQMLMMEFAQSLEIIPRTLCDNAGFDSTDILNKLRKKHYTSPEEGKWFGVDVEREGIADMFENTILEPVANRINGLRAATEACCLILSIDETVRNPQSEQAQMQQRGQMPGGPRGAPMSAAMGGQGMKGFGGGMPGMRMMKGRGGK